MLRVFLNKRFNFLFYSFFIIYTGIIIRFIFIIGSTQFAQFLKSKPLNYQSLDIMYRRPICDIYKNQHHVLKCDNPMCRDCFGSPPLRHTVFWGKEMFSKLRSRID